MNVEKLNVTEYAVMEALRLYRYLTPKQLLRLGVTARKEHLYKTLKSISFGSRSYIAKLDYGVLPGVGRLPSLHYLTRKGAEALAEALLIPLQDVGFPQGAVLINQDYFHRINCLDCQIEISQWASTNNADVLSYDSYFDVTGANRSRTKDTRRAKTKIELNGFNLIPDAIFQLETEDGKKRLFALEVYNGMATKRVLGQLDKYRQALIQGVISDAFNYPSAPRIICIFEKPNELVSVQSRMKESSDFEKVIPYFFFKTLDDFKSGFHGGWLPLNGGAAKNLW